MLTEWRAKSRVSIDPFVMLWDKPPLFSYAMFENFTHLYNSFYTTHSFPSNTSHAHTITSYPSQHHTLFLKQLSPFSVDSMSISVGPSSGMWMIYEMTCSYRKLTLLPELWTQIAQLQMGLRGPLSPFFLASDLCKSFVCSLYHHVFIGCTGPVISKKFCSIVWMTPNFIF